jgi:peptide/nickel transport system permease protein
VSEKGGTVVTYVTKRVVIALGTIFVVVSLSFFMIRLMPGNAMDYLEDELTQEGGLTPQQIQQKINAIYGLMPRAPLWKQYFQYIGHAAQGNFGTSIDDPGETVAHIIANALPWTIFTVGIALVLSFAIGIAIGTMMATFERSKLAKLATLLTAFLSAVPNYMVAIVLIYFLADTNRVFATGGAYSAGVTVGWNLTFIGSALAHAILPIASYVIVGFGAWALQMKGSAVSTLGSEYVRAAEARGLGMRRITQSYVGRNSMLPQVTLLALSLGFMFGGSVFIEDLFNYPGIGYQLINAVNGRDYSVMMGCFVLITTAVVISNLLVDFLYPVVDPRIMSPAAAKKAGLGAKGEAEEQTIPVGGAVA